MKSTPDQIIMTMDEFLAGAQSSTLFQDVAHTAEANRPLIDESRARRDRDWSLLNWQVVGGEILL